MARAARKGRAPLRGGAETSASCRLYLVTPPAFRTAAFARALEAALDAGDVACLQLRLKDAPDDEVRKAARALMPICHARDVAFIVNDLPDLAAELGADGVHIGQTDGTYAAARKAVGPKAIVGVTCHASRHLAMVAGEQGADYVAFGAFFPTTTKAAKSKADPEILRWWSETTVVPAVAIGGITPENCAPLVAAGADFLAVVSAVWDHPKGPAAAVRAFGDVIRRTTR
ncbi:MAG: thiamine phosphate synthase [Alphaproteobacteria bacterium]|nr:thiamine phosphate synthase [Alphaproteobacteria bacterium]